jgi:hypothetical protein
MIAASDVDAAVVQRLLQDPALAALMPDGVFFNTAPLHATRFVVLERFGPTPTYMFGGPAWAIFRYQIKAVALNSTGSDVNAAEARIYALLQDAFDLAIPGAAVMRLELFQGIRYMDPDPENPAIRWQHRGGLYDLQATPLVDTSRQGRELLGQGRG